MLCLIFYVKVGLHFALENIPIHIFSRSYFAHCFTCFASIGHLLCACVQLLILFHITQMRFSPQSTHMLMCFPLENLVSIVRTD